MSIESAGSNRLQPDAERDGMENIFRRFAGIRAAVFKLTKYFSRPRHPASADLAEGAAATAGAVALTPVTPDVNVGLDARIGCDVQSVPDTQEIERRRNLVRTLFNIRLKTI